MVVFISKEELHVSASSGHLQVPTFSAKRVYTGCGRKNSPTWEANKFKIKEDTANFFLFLESTQNTVLHQCVLNKT